MHIDDLKYLFLEDESFSLSWIFYLISLHKQLTIVC